MIALALGNSVVFFLLGAIYFYWAIGGVWATDVVVPIKPTGEKLFNTLALSCVVVAGGLWVMSFVHAVNARLIFVNTTFSVIHYATLAMGVIVRFVGDFKWLGIFKKMSDTAFAKSDTLYFAPLCLFLSVSSFVLFFGQ
ncbi:MAG: DUF3995 domain-containing protein [Cyclobacteriaceae bacterium]|nr:DUF3995 domain-containing protein [Cyclobacteriaceae bacterium]